VVDGDQPIIRHAEEPRRRNVVRAARRWVHGVDQLVGRRGREPASAVAGPSSVGRDPQAAAGSKRAGVIAGLDGVRDSIMLRINAAVADNSRPPARSSAAGDGS
jgi:hypothetical protein